MILLQTRARCQVGRALLVLCTVLVFAGLCTSAKQLIERSAVERPASFWDGALEYTLTAGQGPGLIGLLSTITSERNTSKHVIRLAAGEYELPANRAQLNVTGHISVVGAGVALTSLMARGHTHMIRVGKGASLEFRNVTIIGHAQEPFALERATFDSTRQVVNQTTFAFVYYVNLEIVVACDDTDITQPVAIDPNCTDITNKNCTVFSWAGAAWWFTVSRTGSPGGTILQGNLTDLNFGNVSDPTSSIVTTGYLAIQWLPVPSAIAPDNFSPLKQATLDFGVYVIKNTSLRADPSLPTMREFFADQVARFDSAGRADCYDPIDMGYTYRGTANTSLDGLACLKWGSPGIFPRLSIPNTQGNFTSTEGNLCRNPGQTANTQPPGPWCASICGANGSWQFLNDPRAGVAHCTRLCAGGAADGDTCWVERARGPEPASCGVSMCGNFSGGGSSSGGGNAALILGLSLGLGLGFIAVLLLAGLLYAWRKRRQAARGASAVKTPDQTTAAAPKSVDDNARDVFSVACKYRERPTATHELELDSLAIGQHTTGARGVSNVLTLESAMLGSLRGAPEFNDDKLQRTIVAARGAEAGLVQRVCGKSNEPRVQMLVSQLDALFAAPGSMLGSYKLMNSLHRRVGGQGVVQFATVETPAGTGQVAIKFFLHTEAFHNERMHYSNKNLQHVLPPVKDVCANEDSEHTVLGRALPPMVVTERGEPLDEWACRCKPDFSSSINIIMHVVQRALELHKSGIVHRDIKHQNTMFLYSRNEWTILDFGSAAAIGSRAHTSFSLRYAAPETIEAVERGDSHVVADPAVDVWSLGIMAYELLTDTRIAPAGTKRELIMDMLAGRQALPWEGSVNDPVREALLRRLGFMRSVILRMLQRDASARITLSAALQEWRQVLQSEAHNEAAFDETGRQDSSSAKTELATAVKTSSNGGITLVASGMEPGSSSLGRGTPDWGPPETSDGLPGPTAGPDPAAWR